MLLLIIFPGKSQSRGVFGKDILADHCQDGIFPRMPKETKKLLEKSRRLLEESEKLSEKHRKVILEIQKALEKAGKPKSK